MKRQPTGSAVLGFSGKNMLEWVALCCASSGIPWALECCLTGLTFWIFIFASAEIFLQYVIDWKLLLIFPVFIALCGLLLLFSHWVMSLFGDPSKSLLSMPTLQARILEVSSISFSRIFKPGIISRFPGAWILYPPDAREAQITHYLHLNEHLTIP